jgi:hypothetical protein
MPIKPEAYMAHAQLATRLTQSEIAARLGISRRTAQRYVDRGVQPHHVAELARIVHPYDAALAQEMAAHVGQTPESLGLVPPPTPPAATPPPPASPAPQVSPVADGVVDAIVCAAAEAMDLMPREVRPGLLAAFERAREIGVPVDVVERVLRSRLEATRAAPLASATPATGKGKASTG